LTKELKKIREEYDPCTKAQLVEKIQDVLQSIVHVRCAPSGELSDAEKAQIFKRQLEKLINLTDHEVSRMLNSHFDEIFDLLTPTPFAKLLMWGLEQGDDFFQEDEHGNGVGLWGVIIKELELTSKQKALIKQARPYMSAIRHNYTALLRQFSNYKRSVLQCVHDLAESLNNLRSILTHSQQARYIAWADKNAAMMLMMDIIWKKETLGIDKDLAAGLAAGMDMAATITAATSTFNGACGAAAGSAAGAPNPFQSLASMLAAYPDSGPAAVKPEAKDGEDSRGAPCQDPLSSSPASSHSPLPLGAYTALDVPVISTSSGHRCSAHCSHTAHSLGQPASPPTTTVLAAQPPPHAVPAPPVLPPSMTMHATAPPPLAQEMPGSPPPFYDLSDVWHVLMGGDSAGPPPPSEMRSLDVSTGDAALRQGGNAH